jgi:hypothetical protein
MKGEIKLRIIGHENVITVDLQTTLTSASVNNVEVKVKVKRLKDITLTVNNDDNTTGMGYLYLFIYLDMTICFLIMSYILYSSQSCIVLFPRTIVLYDLSFEFL